MGSNNWKALILLFMSSEKMLITLNGSRINNKVMPIELFHSIVTEDIMDLIAIETNSYVKNDNAKFRETIKLEMEKFLGLVNYMGNVRLPMISLYLSQNPLYNLPLPRRIMRRDRFLSLLCNNYASDDDSSEAGKRIKIQPLLVELNKNFKNVYEPAKYLVIDKTIAPLRGR